MSEVGGDRGDAVWVIMIMVMKRERVVQEV
jgi:hypothetical protein